MPKITDKECSDTGMAITLICLVTFLFFVPKTFVVASGLISLVITMTYPAVLKPLAILWMGLTHRLGAVMSKVLLGVVYFLIITPIGLVRQKTHGGSLQLKEFEKKNSSFFKCRKHTFTSDDLKHPY